MVVVLSDAIHSCVVLGDPGVGVKGVHSVEVLSNGRALVDEVSGGTATVHADINFALIVCHIVDRDSFPGESV